MTQTDPHDNVEQKYPYGAEELQVVGEQLLAKVKELVHEGNVRRIIIRQEDRTIVEIPLTVGVVGVALAPALAAVGVLGALLAQCSIQVIRTAEPGDSNGRVNNVTPYTSDTGDIQ
jgi:Domain of unknown function (DUF4342)